MWSTLVRVLPLMNDAPDSPKVTRQLYLRVLNGRRADLAGCKM